MPSDVERDVEECHPALRPGCSAAFSLVEDDQEHLALIAEVRELVLRRDHPQAVSETSSLTFSVVSSSKYCWTWKSMRAETGKLYAFLLCSSVLSQRALHVA